MKKAIIVLAVLLLAIPAMAAEVEVIGGAGVGHEIGRPAGESFNQVFFGVRAKSWNEEDTKLWTVIRWGQYEEAAVDGLGGKLILSDKLWSDALSPRFLSVCFDVGFMSHYREMKGNERGIAPTVGGGLYLQVTKVIGVMPYYEAVHTGPDAKWKQTGYFSVIANTAFGIGN